jgi:hypothetical protein
MPEIYVEFLFSKFLFGSRREQSVLTTVSKIEFIY